MKTALSSFIMTLAALSTFAASFRGLEDLPGGNLHSFALGVSDGGQVVAGVGTSSAGQEAFRWTAAGGMLGLGNTVPGGFFAYAVDVSRDGTVIAGHGFSANGIEAVRWHNGSGTFIGDLPGGGFQSDVRNMSGDGSALVGYSYSANGVESFRWTAATGLQALGDLPGGQFSGNAYAASDLGAVVVGGSDSAQGQQAFRWENGVMEALGDLPGGTFQSAGLGINSDGSVIVGYSFGTSGPEAFRWTRGSGMIGLGDLSGGTFGSSATSVSADGSIIVGHGTTENGEEAFIWDAVNGIRNLKSVLIADFGLSTELNGWLLMSAEAISSDGTAIAGYGRNPSGQIEAWVVAFSCSDSCQCPLSLTEKVMPNLPINGVGFGGAIAMDEGVMVVGAPGAYGGTGAAYVFRRMGSTWVQEAELRNTGFGGSQFAVSVAISGDTVVVGNPVDNSGTGRVFERVNGSWVLTGELHPDVVFGGLNFSRSVAIDGNIIVASAPRDGDQGSEAGAVYVFRRQTDGAWTREAKFVGSDTITRDEFGHSVAIHGTTIVAGAILANSRKGAAYVFEQESNGAWTQTTKLLGSSIQTDANFGGSVAIDHDTILIGASRESFDDRPGRSYLFVRTPAGAWVEEARLDSPEPITGDEFGYRVAIIGDSALISARWSRCNGSLLGAAYLFTRSANTWALTQKFAPGDVTEYDGFGWAVALDSATMAVGAPNDDQLSPDNGAVYVSQAPQSCALTITCPADLTDVPTDPGQCHATGVDLGSPTIQANCGVATISNNAPPHFPMDDTLVTWTVTDTSGNSATCVQKVTVQDHQPPTINCPANMTVTSQGSGAVVSFNITVSDNCPATVISSPSSGSTFPIGTTTVNATATDAAGNTANCSFTVTVNTAPPPFGCDTSYDLQRAWSTTSNPNGVWTYRAGSQILPAYSWGDSFPSRQPSWQNQSEGNLPAWIFSQVDPISGLDWRAGDIVVHSQDNNLGFGRGQANVVWTSPANGFVTISGAVWMGRNIGRANIWKLFVRGSQLSSGSISSGDAFDRAHPFTFDLGSGGASTLQNIQVSTGDEVVLQIERNSTFGDYVGVNLIVTLTQPAPPAIIEVSIPENSQVPTSRPAYDDVWAVSAPPFPLSVNSGIGIIVNPDVVGGNDNHDFALHQNDGIPSSPRYVASYVPNPDTVTVTYRFNQPVAVAGVEILQHLYGITRVEGRLGHSLNAMVSLGTVFGPSGDVADNFVVAAEADSQIFSFNSSGAAGTIFQLIVRKTAHVAAFANYRIYPLDQNGNRIPITAGCELIEPHISWSSPADIVFGTALGGNQLNATADVPGTFSYSPPAGTVLNAGNQQTLSVTFTPADSANYATASASVTINVLKAVPVLSWADPADIPFGTPLGGDQLNATASVPGAFDYSPPAGTILPIGEDHILSVVFSPSDAGNYNPIASTVRIVVFNPDADNDGLLDADEINTYHTDPNDPDTDGDGLFDGTEVDMAEGGGCPDPLVADSDADGLLDGDEVLLGTSPCAADTDGDGVEDAEDPLPTTPGVTQEYLEQVARDLAAEIDGLALDEFNAANDNANAGRRNALSNRATVAANAIAIGDNELAVDELTSLLQKIDDASSPPDWMNPSATKTALAQDVSSLIDLLF